MDIVNEGTTCYLSVAFKDKDGAAAAPSSVSYRIDCLTTGTAVLGDTSATAAATTAITITAAQNAILGGRPLERRRVTVTGTYAGSEAVREQFDYQVRNLSAVS